jgi:hypothetical protein
LLPLEHPASKEQHQILFDTSLVPELHQERPQVRERTSSRSLEGVDLHQGARASMLVEAKTLKLEEHCRKGLGDTVVKFACEEPPEFLV